jgi:type II secretory pathway component GspD/PulD (secretin)
MSDTYSLNRQPGRVASGRWSFSRQASRRLLITALAAAVVAAVAANETVAQNGPRAFRGDMSKLPPEVRARIEAAQAGAAAAPAAQPGQPAQQPQGDKPKEEEKKPDGEKKEEAVPTVKRPTEKPKADAEELKVKPDKDGMVQFNFRGQSWTDVLEWFAGVAGYSLDWQELPADFLNLSTQRRHTIAETRDLLNRHLLARGFTMVLQGESLSVVKTDKIDPSLVPRVEPDALDDQPPFDFVRARFPLPESMDPAKAVEDVKALLSPAAKVTPLLASKQLQIIDAVANLRDVRDLIYTEQMVASRDIRPQVFPIRYRRADYIADQVMIVLGLDPGSRKNPMELQLEQQRMQLFMQMQQQGKDITTMLKKDGPPVFVAVDKRRNTVLVNAPPKEMEIIERTVKEFDVPENGLAAAEGGDGRELTLRRHPTPNVGPDAVVTALKEMGNLDPLTQLQSDASSRTIFAYATQSDHATIEEMIKKLDDGTARTLHVLYLNRRAPADQIAGTIKALIVGEAKKEESRRPWYYYDSGRSTTQEPENSFRVQADVENNRILLWANKDELSQVTAMLEDLGAMASSSGNGNKLRVLEARTPEQTAELLERLQRAWGGKNELNINAPATDDKDKTGDPAVEPQAAPPNKDKITDRAFPASSVMRVQFAGHRTGRAAQILFVAEGAEQAAPSAAADNQPAEADKPAAAEAAKSAEAASGGPPPINVTVTPDGRIIISSDDVAALDQVEDLLSELEAPRRDFEVFQLRNSRASLVSLNLEEYFADELSDDDNNNFPWFFFGDEPKAEDPATLGKRRKLRFIWDNDTNTIVAQNASPAQLQVIRKLVEIYDQPINEESVAKRLTEVIPVRYSRAQDIATAIKEVYRDLLSSKDKEFQGKQGDQGGPSRNERSWRFGGSSDQKTAPMKVSFEGALSIGVDEISNTIIVSAEEQICKTVHELAITLDEKARPDTVVQVHELRGRLKADDLQKALETALAQPWPGGKPGQAGGGGRGDRDDEQRNRGDRDRGDRDRGGDGDRQRGRD